MFRIILLIKDSSLINAYIISYISCLLALCFISSHICFSAKSFIASAMLQLYYAHHHMFIVGENLVGVSILVFVHFVFQCNYSISAHIWGGGGALYFI